MQKTLFTLITATTLAFANQAIPVQPGQGKGMQHKMQKAKMHKPFLINGRMPHLTKLVMQHWDELNLSDAQKAKLTEIRKATMGAVKNLKPQIMKLEKEVAQAAKAGEKPENLKAKVDQIAKLKAEATMAHLKCIYNTKNVLTPEQLAKLTK